MLRAVVTNFVRADRPEQYSIGAQFPDKMVQTNSGGVLVMTVLKWLLIAFGVLLLVFVATIAGGLYWASTVESVKLTTVDLEVGGTYPVEERRALLESCQKSAEAPASDKDACTCIADKAGTEFSRFERLALTAGFEGSPTKIIALTKGLIESGIPETKAEEMQANSNQRIEGLMETCGLVK